MNEKHECQLNVKGMINLKILGNYDVVIDSGKESHMD